MEATSNAGGACHSSARVNTSIRIAATLLQPFGRMRDESDLSSDASVLNGDFVWLQCLLADRFALKMHQEMKATPVFDLVVARSGPKFKQSVASAVDGQVKRGSIVGQGHIEVYFAGMDILARMLSEFAGRTVVNRTGLSGTFDLKLDWVPESLGPVDSSQASGPTLVTALREQLGLKLEAAKSSVPFFVVDDGSLPGDN